MAMLAQTIARNSSQAARAARSVPANIVSLGSIAMMGALMPFARDAEIYGESEPADTPRSAYLLGLKR